MEPETCVKIFDIRYVCCSCLQKFIIVGIKYFRWLLDDFEKLYSVTCFFICRLFCSDYSVVPVTTVGNLFNSVSR
jgi:hypothetical protein